MDAVVVRPQLLDPAHAPTPRHPPARVQGSRQQQQKASVQQQQQQQQQQGGKSSRGAAAPAPDPHAGPAPMEEDAPAGGGGGGAQALSQSADAMELPPSAISTLQGHGAEVYCCVWHPTEPVLASA